VVHGFIKQNIASRVKAKLPRATVPDASRFLARKKNPNARKALSISTDRSKTETVSQEVPNE
jgi:hypothetical protein